MSALRPIPVIDPMILNGSSLIDSSPLFNREVGLIDLLSMVEHKIFKLRTYADPPYVVHQAHEKLYRLWF